MVSRASSEGVDVIADVIILGSTLPGIVTAYKLKSAFGDTMEVLLLNVTTEPRNTFKFNVAFSAMSDDAKDDREPAPVQEFNRSAVKHLSMYAKEFNLPLPENLIYRSDKANIYTKIFQYADGTSVKDVKRYNNFEYLRLAERFELNQFHNYLDNCVLDLFDDTTVSSINNRKLCQLDKVTMENAICRHLFFQTSRDFMRMTVHLTCGASPEVVSLLFFLHQCFRTKSSRNHLDGNNIRLREKLHGSYRRRLIIKLKKQIKQLSINSREIEHIGLTSEDQVVLESRPGEPRYICDMLAVALYPEQLAGLQVQDNLMGKDHLMHVVRKSTMGISRKFRIQYEENFWRPKGLSGDIFSLKGPIAWAIEVPTPTHQITKRPCLIGLLYSKEEHDSQAAVVEQLVQLFGDEARSPLGYYEDYIADISYPPIGEYFKVLQRSGCGVTQRLEWGSLDIFADGDVAASIEAGHRTYLQVVRCLRPQALDFDEVIAMGCPKVGYNSRTLMWLSQMSYFDMVTCAALATSLFVGYRVVKSAYKF